MKRVAVFVLGGLMVVIGLFAPSTASADAGAPDITVTHTAGAGGSQCEPAALASSATLNDTGTAWVIRITANAPICGPVSAAIYQMPNNMFYPWPQHLIEVESLNIQPGVTTITFTKTCTPTQFDLVTGPTPEYINPSTGPMVNLLYMVPWSGIQYWPTANCTGTSGTSTTTIAPTTTSVTTTTVAPTTTVPQSVNSVTTTVPSAVLPNTAVNTTTTAPAGVEAAQETKSASTPAATVGDLAFTGASEQVLVYGGIALMLMGVATSIASRRRALAQR